MYVEHWLRPEDSFEKTVLSSHQVGSGYIAQVLRLGSRFLHSPKPPDASEDSLRILRGKQVFPEVLPFRSV